MLSGLLPPAHPVRTNDGLQIPSGVRLVSESLYEAGYDTGAFVGAALLHADTGSRAALPRSTRKSAPADLAPRGIVLDMVVLSKSLSSGYAPLAEVIVSGRIAEELREAGVRFAHGFTYGGNPLSAAVGLEVLDVLEEEKLIDRVAFMGDRLLQGLETLREIPIVGDVRGKGLLLGVEFVADRDSRRPFPPALGLAERVRVAALAEGLSVYPGSGSANGTAGDHVLIAPPFIIDEAQVNQLVDCLRRAIRRVERDLPSGV